MADKCGRCREGATRNTSAIPKSTDLYFKIFTEGIDWFADADVRTGWLQIFPACMRRLLAPLRQRWFRHLDLSEYDLIISVTGAEAKGVKSGRWLHEHGKKSVNPKGIHISYCHVPTQYYWQMYDEYVENPGFGILNPVVRLFFKLMVKPLRKGDYRAAQVPDYYVQAPLLLPAIYASISYMPSQQDQFSSNLPAD